MPQKYNAAELMSRHLITIRYDAKLEEAFMLMHEKGIRHLPVVDDQHRMVGILSDRDLQRAMIPELLTGPEVEYRFDPDHQVSLFMSWPVKTVSDQVLIEDVAYLMFKEKISAFVVVSSKDSDQPLGIITTDDLLKLLCSLLEKNPESKGLLLKDTEFFTEFAVG